ncbi:FAD-dependent oxidoreductase [Propionimicrobium lymphophilum]|uniref:Mycothione reductase n=1 Tax=Propionimicrobium lymphophilum ACS-093-V-SCH5 TaxID=883161 RepID=S2VXU1_9ACTN|nr:FAD-dependent oxidoreductase [Propionimicrobium lymphophilum]EPD32323.1 mycothione reductase [Propionimicrobium lymphophilum ACS-093-V-SCH5]MDK7709451.1 FAD-dependent oxidoreductase [Propionimicrobium lymphophilum]MDK7733437.1 FAD-dependent oxidoreductase [Propionimicrobium lymphophilum]
MSEHFDLCVIGSGSGLAVMPPEVTERWRTALIDPGTGPTQAFGGTCLNAGCIPSKMLSIPASSVAQVPDAERMNVSLTSQGIDFNALRKRTFNRTDAISDGGLEWQLSRENVQVFRDYAHFLDEHTLQVGDEIITADRFVIAAGSRPRQTDKPGFNERDLQPFIHTSESVMRLEEVPERLVILGGGTEAVEFAHIFSALGSTVTVINRSGTLLRKMDEDIAKAVTDALSERVAVRLNQSYQSVDAAPEGGVVVTAKDSSGIEYTYQADIVLSVIGRVPNADVLDVEKAGVELDDSGLIVTDELQRTSADHIWAIGDICNTHMLKHLANVQARVVLADIKAKLAGDELKVEDRPGPRNQDVVPMGIYITPEVGSIGLTEQEAKEIGPYAVFTQKFSDTAWGWAMNDGGHFAKILAKPDGTLLGAHIVGPQATSLLQPIISAMVAGLSAREAADRQFWPHPAPVEVVENALLGVAEEAEKLNV